MMEALFCKNCGSNALVKEPGSIYFCQYCGSRFVLPNNYVRTESEIVISEDVKRLLNMCVIDPANARKYANLILDIDPGNQQALYYLR